MLFKCTFNRPLDPISYNQRNANDFMVDECFSNSAVLQKASPFVKVNDSWLVMISGSCRNRQSTREWYSQYTGNVVHHNGVWNQTRRLFHTTGIGRDWPNRDRERARNRDGMCEYIMSKYIVALRRVQLEGFWWNELGEATDCRWVEY